MRTRTPFCSLAVLALVAVAGGCTCRERARPAPPAPATPACAPVELGVKPVPPNLHILLGRGGSMSRKMGDRSAWEVTRSALVELFEEHAGRVRFGVQLYPEEEDCLAAPAAVHVGAHDAPELAQALPPAPLTDIAVGRPIAAALALCVHTSGLQDAAHPNHVLLLTDGWETCQGDVLAQVQTLQAERGIRTSMIVLADSDPAASAEVAKFATAAATAVPGASPPVVARDATELKVALRAIVGRASTCSLEVDPEPPHPSALRLEIGGRPFAPRHGAAEDGWEYLPASRRLVLHGTACEAATQASGSIRIISGCP